MTLTSGSPRIAGAKRFGRFLKITMTTRKISESAMAREMGISRPRLSSWRNGITLPDMEMAGRIADYLMNPLVVEMVKEARTVTCADERCGRSFIAATGAPQQYCSVECKRTRAKLASGSRDLSRAVLERRAARYRTAVGLMCIACEPSGTCRTPTCPLQVAGVSPHWLVEATR